MALYALLALLGYAFHEWRHLQLFISLACLPWIIYVWYECSHKCPDSKVDEN